MVRRVVITRGAQKDLAKAPTHVATKLHGWVVLVAEIGLEEVRKIPGYHDEPLKGSRKGQRSIRLSKAWRAIYELALDNVGRFVSIEEVNKHKY